MWASMRNHFQISRFIQAAKAILAKAVLPAPPPKQKTSPAVDTVTAQRKIAQWQDKLKSDSWGWKI